VKKCLSPWQRVDYYQVTKWRCSVLLIAAHVIPFATWDRSTVPDKPPHVGVGHWTSVPAICCSTETDRSTVPSELGRRLAVGRFRWQVRQSGMHYRTVWEIQSSRADFRDFQASFEDLLLRVILDVSHVQRIRYFLVMRYINVRFTYLLSLHVSR